MVNFGISLLCGGFKSSKCKTMAKMAVARIKLLRNKRDAVVKQMRRDISLLLQSKQDATARIRVEHVIREQNIMAANEIIELFCELIVARLTIISKQRECPADLKEGISSLIFASPRCSDIPELLQLRDIFEKKYGKEFVSAATDLRPNCGVNRTLIEKLSVRTPTGEVKLKLMKEIAKEYQIHWDPTESEKELLKPPDELIEGPCKFVSAATIPVNPVSLQDIKPVNPVSLQDIKPTESANRVSNDRENSTYYENTALAAQAAAESAQKAVAAAQAAAYLANRSTQQVPRTTDFNNSNVPSHSSSKNSKGHGNSSKFSPTTRFSNGASDSDSPLSSNKHTFGNSTDSPQSNDRPVNYQDRVHHSDLAGRKYEPRSSDNEEVNSANMNSNRMHRRHSYNVPATRSDIKFDESERSDSDYDEEMEMETPPNESHPPPNRLPPSVPQPRVHQHDDKIQTDDANAYRRHSLPRVHPKLPDYDELSARFESLKSRKP